MLTNTTTLDQSEPGSNGNKGDSRLLKAHNSSLTTEYSLVLYLRDPFLFGLILMTYQSSWVI